MHSYELTASGEVIPRHDADLKMVREHGYFPSVTTKLKMPSNDFLDLWRQHKTIDYTIENPRGPNEDIKDYYNRIDWLVWQPRTRWDGVVFSSNDFGTECHAQLENWHKDPDYEFDHDWDYYCHQWPMEFQERFKLFHDSTLDVGAEVMVACPLLKIAGTLDVLGEDLMGRYALCDFKFRPHKGRPQTQTRDKDCQQLAIEADIVRRQKNLDYFPDCYSAVGCVDSGAWYVKRWSDKMVHKHLVNALSINLTYNVLNGLETLEEAMDKTQRVLAGEAE